MFGITFKREADEKLWLDKALGGDNSATEWIYRRYVRYLSALCSRYITCDEDIRDVLQESFIKIFTSLDRFQYRGSGSLKTWMAKITLNETLKFLRHSSRLAFAGLEEADKNIADSDNIITENIPTAVLHQFIRELPDGYRTVFNLFVIEEMSHKEIASLLGISESTSASQLHKAKAMLAKKITRYEQ